MIEFGVLLAAYLIGSIPVGLVIGKLKGVDIRQYGSGKTGTTNVLRNIGTKYAVIALIADILKGVIAVIIARYTLDSPYWEMGAAFAAIAGHNWSIFIKFQGGRGVATAGGGLYVMQPWVSTGTILLFFIIAGITRYASVGSITGALSALITMIVLLALDYTHIAYVMYTGVAATLIIVAHYDNIKRLLAGTENKIGHKGKKLDK